MKVRGVQIHTKIQSRSDILEQNRSVQIRLSWNILYSRSYNSSLSAQHILAQCSISIPLENARNVSRGDRNGVLE